MQRCAYNEGAVIYKISFCAYNTGIGWRNIIEMHMIATLTRWYDEHGRHEIFAGGEKVALQSAEHSMVLRDGIITTEVQHDLDKLGSPRTPAKRNCAPAPPKSSRTKRTPAWRSCTASTLLKEQPTPDLVPRIQLAPKLAPKPAPVERVEEREEVGSFGD